MDNATLKAQHVAAAQDAVDAALAKVDKLEAHLEGARAGVDLAWAELARVRASDYVWEEPTEHVIARVQ